ncbi:ATP-binding cassette domain-containing protein [Phytoactinopolyspora halotolerans]|uniref:ATP-binding cassette domain-containing protein n=1 Tax=Phytoactinopolyspora halotolerans TaxID=1981512 RepID=A0A6L9SFA9_9ACTN|nr:ATP-binding cassette domain-containing protein [Phytoactinopolyspora halotolerans]NEE03809.1 ATP-binding cassette domain-containing protein [Phytoactinopolyspora halotolerans]
MAEPIIEVDGLVKVFRGNVRALDGLSLQVEQGIVYGLLGPNGAGKTTLIRVLTTLLAADAGSASVAGIDLNADPQAVRSRIGLAGQFAAVDDYLTGRENVELVGRLYGFSRRDARQRAATVLERIGMLDVADRQVKTYSGGMRRRIDLAASLVGSPQVLFLDEPTTGIDPASRRSLWELIRHLLDDGTTIVLTTQYLDEADQLADRIAVIDHGRLVSEGTTADLKNRVGGTVLDLSVSQADRPNALAVLEEAVVGGVTVDPGRDTIVLPASDGVTTLYDVLGRLDRARITPTDVALHRPTLDDVFLALTGSVPGNEAAAGAAVGAGTDRETGADR